MTLNTLIDLIKYPIITDKATKLLEINQYTFAVDSKSNKTQIKTAIEYLFNVKVISVNTAKPPAKQRRIGKFMGTRTQYKKAILTLATGNSINLFSEN
jgi:large subunit ribosomal protein L23|uniref:ribosomal protein L23 n=1 Tax=Cryptomonas pyrenoidifera TaxID=233184 RepID=UPI0022A705A9|nr:ribosomal protein L23 [Cryptomonas pyrenoidifera]UZS90627.1 ribosomal protein L23 [Cryptomonas pyrenoidifera]